MIRLSIIVPFYNVEKYIEQCIRSLYDQDIPQDEYEVICVDDCSPDGSRTIVERLQKKYPTLRLIIHERNKKLGGARNTGLKAANGEYIWFVDSDDYIMPNIFGKLLQCAESKQLDILHFDIATDTKGQISNVQYGIYPCGVVSGVDLFFASQALWYICHITAWQKLLKRDFLQSISLEFAENVFSEDDDYSFVAYAKAKRTMHMDIICYVYRTNESSIMHNKLNPIYVYSELLQIYRFSTLWNKLTTTDARFRDAILGDVRDAIIQVNRQLPQLNATDKQVVRDHVPLRALWSMRKVIAFHTYLLLLKKLYSR